MGMQARASCITCHWATLWKNRMQTQKRLQCHFNWQQCSQFTFTKRAFSLPTGSDCPYNSVTTLLFRPHREINDILGVVKIALCVVLAPENISFPFSLTHTHTRVHISPQVTEAHGNTAEQPITIQYAAF